MHSWDSLFIGALYVYIFITIIYLLLDNREAPTTLSWLLVFIFIPFVGLFLYFIFGRGMRKQIKKILVRQNLENRLQNIHKELIYQQKHQINFLQNKYITPGNQKLIRLLYKNSDSILTQYNDVKVFFDGEDKFYTLINDLKKAKSYIHMEYFIWKSDSLTEKVVSILKEKVAQGVKVKILYDLIGNYLSKKYLKRLRKSGIKIFPYYNFMAKLKIHTLNYRNHRKIVIIDGVTCYLGGMNMGEEYINGGNKFPFWRDTHIRIQGSSAAVLEEIFSVSWTNTTKEVIETKSFIPSPYHKTKNTHLQITTSGPDSEWESIKQLYFLLISSAEKSIYIHTPYFIPDSSIVMALKTAALSDIDVRIMLTGWIDKRLPYWAGLTYLEDLLNAGVKFYRYTKGFMHAKTIVVDSQKCSIGTANLDIRSFELNYEINALIYDEPISKKIEAMFFKDIESAREFTQDDYNKISRAKQLRNSFARLFGPLL